MAQIKAPGSFIFLMGKKIVFTNAKERQGVEDVFECFCSFIKIERAAFQIHSTIIWNQPKQI